MPDGLVLEFEIIIRRPESNGAPYAVLALTPAGPATGTFAVNSQDQNIQRLLNLVRSEGPDLPHRQALGRILYQELFRDSVRDMWQQTRGRFAGAEVPGLRVRLWIEPPELALWPWELIGEEDFLATRADCFVSRYLPGIEPPFLATPVQLRVLVVWADPGPPGQGGGLSEVPETEVKLLTEKLDALGDKATYKVLRNPALGDVQALLGQGYHVLHYLGHGEPDRLLWIRPDGQVEPIGADALGQLVLGHRTLRLAVLSACNSAQTNNGIGGLYSGVGPTLVRRGVPAVLAMQYPFVYQSTAGMFNAAFYGALCAGAAVDEAVTLGRQKIAATGQLLEQRDWSTPVLYLGTRFVRLLGVGGKDPLRQEWEAVRTAAERSLSSQAAVRGLVQRLGDVGKRIDELEAMVKLHVAARSAQEMWDPTNQIIEQTDRLGNILTDNQVADIKRAWRVWRSTHWPRVRGLAAVFTGQAMATCVDKLAQAVAGLDDALGFAADAGGGPVKKILVPERAAALHNALASTNYVLQSAVGVASDEAIGLFRQTLAKLTMGS